MKGSYKLTFVMFVAYIFTTAVVGCKESNTESPHLYNLVHTDLGNPNQETYRIVVDSLPTEEDGISIAEEVVKEKKAKFISVFFTRSGFPAESGADAAVDFEQGKDYKPFYRVIGLTNNGFNDATKIQMDTLPGKDIQFEGIDRMGIKLFIYTLPDGQHYSAIMPAPGSYQIEGLQTDGKNGGDRHKFRNGDRVYSLDQSGSRIDILNDGALVNSYVLLKTN